MSLIGLIPRRPQHHRRDRDLRDRLRLGHGARILRLRLGADLHAAGEQHGRAAAGRGALLLIIDFVAAVPLMPNAWKQADRKATAVMVFGALIGVPVGTYFLSRLDPVTTRWIISGFVFALLLLLLSGWRYRGKDHAAISVGIGGLSGFCSGLAQTGGPPIVGYWLGRPVAPVIARANILLFFGASDFFSAVSYSLTGLITSDAIRFSLLVGPVYAIGVCFGAQLFGRASETPVPRDLLRADCGGGRHRAAGAGWGVAVALRSSPRRRGSIARHD